MDRSLIFTALMEEPEFRRLESHDGSRLVTDAQERWQQDSKANPRLTLWACIQQYIADVTGNRTCEPGVWQRYVDTLKAGDEVKASNARITTPAPLNER